MKFLRFMELFLYSFVCLCLTSDTYSFTQEIIRSATKTTISETIHPDLSTIDSQTSDWLVPLWMENVMVESHNQSPLSTDTLTAQGAIPEALLTQEEVDQALAENNIDQPNLWQQFNDDLQVNAENSENFEQSQNSEPPISPDSPENPSSSENTETPQAISEETSSSSEKTSSGSVINVVPNHVAGSTTTAAERNYSHGTSVSASTAVSNSYFANTAVIGDSRSQGLMSFGGMGGTNMTYVGLSVYNIWNQDVYNGMTVIDALSRGNYDRVYIGLGLNCIGYPSSTKFHSLYSELVDEIRKINPNMEIYIQNIFPVNESIIYSRGTSSYINNASIREFNTILQNMCKSKNLHYLDLYSYFADDNGELPAKASTDGLHFGSEYSRIWAEYLRTHTISW